MTKYEQIFGKRKSKIHNNLKVILSEVFGEVYTDSVRRTGYSACNIIKAYNLGRTVWLYRRNQKMMIE